MGVPGQRYSGSQKWGFRGRGVVVHKNGVPGQRCSGSQKWGFWGRGVAGHKSGGSGAEV